MNIPEYIIVRKELYTVAECDACGKSLKHSYIVKNTITGAHSTLGSGCVQKVTGNTVKELYTIYTEYENSIREEKIQQEQKLKVQDFKEANPDMMKFIEDGANKGDTFLLDMKQSLETYGTLTQGQYSAVYTSMLEVKELDPKVKDLCVTIIRVKKSFSHFGENVTLFCESDDNKLVRVYFSGWTDALNNFFIDNRLFDEHNNVKKRLMEIKQKICVSGSFDGYKIKRAKIRNV